MPGILYGVDAIPISDTAIVSIETIQCQVGKSALLIPQSTANSAVHLELGWKPVQLLVDEAVLCFFLRVTDPSFKGSGLVTSCMAWARSSTSNPYTANLLCLAAFYNVSLTNLPNLTLKSLRDHWVTRLLTRVQSLPSLSLLPISPPWWRPSRFLESTHWSQVLVKFRTMNAGLGNRDAYRGADAVSQDDGRVTQCPLCLIGPNNELHLVMHCRSLVTPRLSIRLRGGVSLPAALESVCTRHSCTLDVETLRMFLGQEPGLSRLDLVDRSLALDVLVDYFFQEWSKSRGRAVTRADRRPWH